MTAYYLCQARREEHLRVLTKVVGMDALRCLFVLLSKGLRLLRHAVTVLPRAIQRQGTKEVGSGQRPYVFTKCGLFPNRNQEIVEARQTLATLRGTK